MPTLAPVRTSTPEATQQHKAWEYNFNGNNSSVATTAQVIGVFEPNQGKGCLVISKCSHDDTYAYDNVKKINNLLFKLND